MTVVASQGNRDSTEELHEHVLHALGSRVVSHTDITQKPLNLDLRYPLPLKVRLYVYHATVPPGADGQLVSMNYSYELFRAKHGGNEGTSTTRAVESHCSLDIKMKWMFLFCGTRRFTKTLLTHEMFK